MQLLTRVYAYGQDPQAASDAPRFFVESDGTVLLEHGIPLPAEEGLRKLGHPVRIERSAAQQYVEQYFRRYPGVKQYMDATREMAFLTGSYRHHVAPD